MRKLRVRRGQYSDPMKIKRSARFHIVSRENESASWSDEIFSYIVRILYYSQLCVVEQQVHEILNISFSHSLTPSYTA